MTKFSELNEGDSHKNEKITKLFAAKDDMYIIYEGNNNGEVTIDTNDAVLRQRCSELSSRISVITEYLVSRSDKRKYVSQIGLAYAEAIEDKIDFAKSICDKLIVRIELYKSNIGRFYYLVTCLILVILCLLFSFILNRFKIIPEIVPHFYVMTFASIGGFLSISKNIKKLKIDSSDFGWFQIFYGFTRIIISMFSGLIIYALMKSELLLPKLNSNENFYIVCIMGVLAGFSESLIPNLFNSLESKAKIK